MPFQSAMMFHRDNRLDDAIKADCHQAPLISTKLYSLSCRSYLTSTPGLRSKVKYVCERRELMYAYTYQHIVQIQIQSKEHSLSR